MRPERSWGRSPRITGDPVRQHSHRNRPAGFQGDGPFHGVFELANVSRPIVGLQARHGFRRDALNGLIHGLTETLEEVACEERDIFAAITQGWHHYGNHAEAIIKVLT